MTGSDVEPTPLRGAALAGRLIASIVTTPLGLAGLIFNTEMSGSPGGRDEARWVAWWLEPFRQLRRRR